MKNDLCPRCGSELEIRERNVISYDLLIAVEEIIYGCPRCGHGDKVEILKQI